MSKYSNSSLLAAGERVSDEQMLEEMKVLNFSRAVSRQSRRDFVTALGAAAAAAGALGLAGCSDSGTVPITTNNNPNPANPTVSDVLNFALNLEYLEASFYSYIATGNGLAQTDLGGSSAGTITPVQRVTFTNSAVQTVANNLALDEIEHVQFLRGAMSSLGLSPVAAPALNLAAMGAVTSDASFLMLARQLETVGISAYAGGAQYLVSNGQVVTYAAQILHTEAQHEGALRQLCIELGVTSPAVDNQDRPPTSTQIFNTDPTTGLNAVRTPSQVLQIVYGAAGQTGVAKGGFFPNGLNGNIHLT